MKSATDDPFVSHRSLLFTIAYEILGSAADAADVLQESWLRWAGVDRHQVRDARAYLVQIVTRQALNCPRTASRQREDYVGEWLPEPLLTTHDVAEDIVLAERGYLYLRLTPRRVLAWRSFPERRGAQIMTDGRWLA